LNAVADPDPNLLPLLWQRAWRWGAPLVTLAALAVITLGCLFNPAIHFLSPGPGKWIVYPLPSSANLYPGFQLVSTFHRSFVLPEKPAAATVSWRCLTNGGLIVNNTNVPPPELPSDNWKTVTQADVASFLHPGTNEISVLVTNYLGPPALGLEFKAGDFSLKSDESWEVSISGSVWRPARAAATVPAPGKDNPLSQMETTGGAFQRCWPWLCLFAGLAAGATALIQHFAERTSSFQKMALIVVGVAWALLFLHNARLMPEAAGFDGEDHLDYVRYLQEYHSLPTPSEGWEMVQPPLYYIVSAGLLGMTGCKVFTPAGMLWLRLLNLAIGAATVTFVFLGLRLLFPNDWKKPLAGTVLAAFLPAQLYLLHYTTNETFSAMFVTGALCVTLLLLRNDRSSLRSYVVLGALIGLALLSKSSALLIVPVIFGALALKLAVRREQSPKAWAVVIGLPLAACLAVSGWHYIGLIRTYGSPFVGGWDPRIFAPWWQQPGFQRPGYYFSFGQSLVHPFFSGLHSFWDGIYSTLWGDGLCGGTTGTLGRPPWNYDLMAAGFILALVPTILVLTGLARMLAASFRAPRLVWIFLIGIGWIVAFAMLDMTINEPSYAHAKAFFGLPALLPFCALGVLGFEFWTGLGKTARWAVAVALGTWLINVYASFWIKPHTLQTELSRALGVATSRKEDSLAEFVKVLNHFPHDTRTAVCLAISESQKNPQSAVTLLEQVFKANPGSGPVEGELGRDLALCGRMDEAVMHARHAFALAPEDGSIARMLCAIEEQCKNHAEAIAAGRQALGLDPTDLHTHYCLGLALMNTGQFAEAATQLASVVDSTPNMADAQYDLGLCLLRLPDQHDDAVTALQQAVSLNPTNSAWQLTLTNAQSSH
jgi:Flp pilus assembly protein TadD